MKYSAQSPASVVMIRPHHFSVNPQTAQDNAFQTTTLPANDQAVLAYAEHSEAVKTLESHGIKVHLFEGESPSTPDCVFPNNWFSTHSGGYVAVYPMKVPNRRQERRTDILEALKAQYRVQEVVDFSGLEIDRLYLEGTGAMVLDHVERVAYAVQSDRTNPIALERFCARFNYEPMTFPASDPNGLPIYHTNVLMSIASDFVLIGADMITDAGRKQEVLERLQDSGRQLIILSPEQITAFAGNAIELQGPDGRILALSKTAYDALTEDQLNIIGRFAKPVPLRIPTIECAGGSVRCTIAGIHLSPR